MLPVHWTTKYIPAGTTLTWLDGLGRLPDPLKYPNPNIYFSFPALITRTRNETPSHIDIGYVFLDGPEKDYNHGGSVTYGWGHTISQDAYDALPDVTLNANIP